MKTLLTIAIIFFSFTATGQTIDFKTGGSLTVSPLFITDNSLYFRQPASEAIYKIQLSQLSSYTPVKTIKPKSPELYLMDFRRQQLAGVWLGIAGILMTGIGAAIDEKILTYAGVSTSFIGFAVSVSSFSQIKNRYIIMEATEYNTAK